MPKKGIYENKNIKKVNGCGKRLDYLAVHMWLIIFYTNQKKYSVTVYFTTIVML